MKIPMKYALVELRGARQCVPVTPKFSVTRASEKIDGSYVRGDVKYRVVYQAVCNFEMIVADDEIALQRSHEKAERMLMQNVYGPVVEELVKILHHCWEQDVDHDTAHMIQRLADDLK